ncbi:hypothetical protein C8R46DRAFT_1206029 [Mycena filopes]|nr:hypothetical protein C8R46DRAFT_1206029 [Mycena filopes]
MLLRLLVIGLSASSAKAQSASNSASSLRIPTTTDFPAPASTNPSSDISSAYSDYIKYCGQNMETARQEAISEYQFQLKTDPADPTSPDFIAWATEDDYKVLLATFVPETTFANSTSGTQAIQSETASSLRLAPSGGAGDANHSGSASDNAASNVILTMTTLLCLGLGY